MTIPMGDQPDWSISAPPNILQSSVYAVGFGNVSQLLQSSSPYRIWGAWLTLGIAVNGSYNAGSAHFGVKIGDGSGLALIGLQAVILLANQVHNLSIALPMPGYVPKISGGFYTTNLLMDAQIVNTTEVGSGGILYSQP